MNNICTICARGGSKGVPNKNIKLLNGIHLITYTINQAIQSKLFSKIVVSTDSQKIANVALAAGAECWFLRPKYLSSDKASFITGQNITIDGGIMAHGGWAKNA